MRRPWWRALVLGLMVGPASAVAEPFDFEPDEGERRTLARPPGHAVRGLNFHVWDENPQEAIDWAAELIRAGGKTLEVEGWRSIARRSAVLPPILTDPLEAESTIWSGVSGGDHGISPLGCVLCLLPSPDRAALISSWATSPNEPIRRALARALAAPFEATCVRAAIDQLRKDPSAEVRRLARCAASRRAADETPRRDTGSA